VKTFKILLCGTVLVVILTLWWSAAVADDGKPRWDDAVAVPPAPWSYEVSACELSPDLRAAAGRCWTMDQARSVLAQRVAVEKQRRELRVVYYRIGYPLAFPLPLSQRLDEAQLPMGIEGIRYPWTTWLSWELEQRWRILHAGWRHLDDAQAGDLLQRELAALSGWDDYLAAPGRGVSLVTAHLAASLALGLADSTGWDPALYQQTLAAAQALLERDVRPWFDQTWDDARPLTPARMHNIPVIALVRSAQLARVVRSPGAERLEARARDVLLAWWALRTGDQRHSEGTAYDGYLADAITEWLAGLPDRDELLVAGREPFGELVDHWVQLTLPGRVDLHPPLGDVEPEMPFWGNALMRLAGWYELDQAGWLLRRWPLQRLPAAALAAVADHTCFLQRQFAAPPVGPGEQLASVSLRTGWESRDMLVAVGLPRCDMGHLHPDGGHVILGWHGRFWITDPGYQQYRPGLEREYTLGPQAHNMPVIGGISCTRRTSRLEALGTDERGRQHAALDLTGAYAGLPENASVRRDFWLIPGDAPAVVVRDSFAGLPPGTEVRTHWLGGAHLAWAFPGGWARLSDGERALWVAVVSEAWDPAKLTRHPGSRGPLTLRHATVLPQGEGTRWWIFQCDPSLQWTSPSYALEGDTLRLRMPGQTAPAWELE
jgi:hypothetical protein